MLMSMESRRDKDKDIELTIEDRETIEPSLLYRRRDRAVRLIGETLLNAGCDINAADNKGRAPLIYAVAFGRSAVIELFLKRGRKHQCEGPRRLKRSRLGQKIRQ